MAMALATVTSMIKLFDAPMGGSVTLCSMLFITLIAYWYNLSYIGIEGAITLVLISLPPVKNALLAVKKQALGE